MDGEKLKMKKSVVIVIPIYKHEITADEKLSLIACCRVLGNYPIVFVCGKKLQTATYEEIIKAENCDFHKITFADNNFKDIKSYSKFCLNSNFYQAFSEYKYMLLYQLDACVFRDELQFWIESDYDYIGAPWYNDRKGAIIPENKLTLFGVGNGGFSLRKISAINTLIKNPLSPFIKLSKSFPTFPYIKETIHAFLLKIIGKNEDIIIHRWGKAGLLKIPVEQDVLGFAFDTHPELSFRLNNEKLPFGCHAWIKNKQFWKNYIES